MRLQLRHQFRRTFPRNWLTSELAGQQNNTLVNMFFVSETATKLWVCLQEYSAARFSGMKSNSQGSLTLWSKRFAHSAESNLSWSQICVSCTQADLYRVASSVFRIGLFRLSKQSHLTQFFFAQETLLEWAARMMRKRAQHEFLNSVLTHLSHRKKGHLQLSKTLFKPRQTK